jgi:hypothetical protein
MPQYNNFITLCIIRIYYMNSADGFFKNSLFRKTSTYLMVLSISRLYQCVGTL